MRLVTTMQFWLDVNEDDDTTPELVWQRCLDAQGQALTIHDVANDTALRLMMMPGVIKSQVIVAAAEPITGSLRETFDQQRVDEEHLLDHSAR